MQIFVEYQKEENFLDNISLNFAFLEKILEFP